MPGEGVIEAPIALRAFESDGLTAYRQMPLVAVLPETVAQVAAVLRYAHDNDIKVVPRGAGTSLSGGALPLADGILLGMAKFNRIRDIDYANRCAVVEPGVTNLAITRAVESRGFYYAPDPSSQIACTIGGNVAENSGGVHCLKYGLTANNVLGIEMVLVTGEVIRLGGKHLDAEGYDLLGVMTGSEGLLGVVTEVTVRILQKPETARAVLVGDENGVVGVRLVHAKTGAKREVPVQGVFIAIGHQPSTELVLGQLKMKPSGYVWTAPHSTATSVPGVFAAGDVAAPEVGDAAGPAEPRSSRSAAGVSSTSATCTAPTASCTNTRRRTSFRRSRSGTRAKARRWKPSTCPSCAPVSTSATRRKSRSAPPRWSSRARTW